MSSDCAALDAIAGAQGVSGWARPQMGWAVDQGIISGAVVDGVAWVDPQGTAQRCQVAKMATVFHRDVLGLQEEVADYANNVNSIGAQGSLSEDGASMLIPNSTSKEIAPGQIVLVEPSAQNPNGASIKVSSIEKTSNGETLVYGTQPTFNEIYADLVIHDSLDANTGELSLLNGIKQTDNTATFYSVDSTYEPKPITLDLSTLNAAEFVTGLEFDGTIVWEPRVDFNLDIKREYYDIECQNDFIVDASVSKGLLPGGEVRIPIAAFSWQTTGNVGVSLGLYLKVSLDGTFSLQQDIRMTSKMHSGSDPEHSIEAGQPTFEIKTEGNAGPAVGFYAGGYGVTILEGEIEGGVHSVRTATFHPDLTCVDIDSTEFGGAHLSFLKGFGQALVDVSSDVVNESNSPWHVTKHYENDVLVPKCTWSNPGNPGSGVDDDYEPPIEDNGYGTTPIYDSDGDLAEPFNVFAGTTISLMNPASDPRLNMMRVEVAATPGSIVRITRFYRDGTSSVEVGNWGFWAPWSFAGSYIVEVLYGRLTFYEIDAASMPDVSFGTCEKVPFPFHVSETDLTMKVGEKYTLTAWHDFFDHGVTGFVEDTPFTWYVKDNWHMGIESVHGEWAYESEKGAESSTYEIEALAPGTATVRVTFGKSLERYINVTVVE